MQRHIQAAAGVEIEANQRPQPAISTRERTREKLNGYRMDRRNSANETTDAAAATPLEDYVQSRPLLVKLQELKEQRMLSRNIETTTTEVATLL